MSFAAVQWHVINALFQKALTDRALGICTGLLANLQLPQICQAGLPQIYSETFHSILAALGSSALLLFMLCGCKWTRQGRILQQSARQTINASVDPILLQPNS